MARRHLAHALADWPTSVQDTAVLLISELVSNAVLHGAPPVHLSIHLAAERNRVRVEVHDANPQLLLAPAHGHSNTNEHGRGLQIIDALAADWGSQATDTSPGKVSWFEVTTV